MKVIRIDASNAIVGCDNGTTKTYPLSAFNYTPMVGMKCRYMATEQMQSSQKRVKTISRATTELVLRMCM